MLSVASGKSDVSVEDESGRKSMLTPARGRELRKLSDKLERQLSKLDAQIIGIHDQMLEFTSDFERVAQLDQDLRELNEKKKKIEVQWLETANELSGGLA
jgi:ATP-binding cassette subfamily F protein uup